MRKAFSMIELVFVIMIIGVLAVVAMPKLTGVQDQATAVKAGEFVGKLNSIVLPELYAKAVARGVHESTDNHALTHLETTVTDVTAFKKLMEIPQGFTMSDITTTTMGSSNTAADQALFVNSTNQIKIWCKDGNTTEFPRCWYNIDGSTPSNEDFNVSKTSF